MRHSVRHHRMKAAKTLALKGGAIIETHVISECLCHTSSSM